MVGEVCHAGDVVFEGMKKILEGVAALSLEHVVLSPL